MKIDILRVKIDSLTQVQVLERIGSFFRPQANQPLADNSTSYKLQVTSFQIITANPEIALEAWQNKEYMNLINNAAVVVPDGIGLLWAAKFLSLKSNSLFTSLAQILVTGASLVFYPGYCQKVLPERIPGVDLMEKICELASRKNWKIYLLGGEEGIAQKTAEVLKNKYLNLNIVGAEEGIKDFKTDNISHELVQRINQSSADILFVAMGAPKQDFFIKQILPQLPSVKVAMGVGGAFDFISGKTKRAPIIYQDIGLEWLWRLFNQPWRFFRIFNATVKFVWTVIKFKQISNHNG